MQSRPIKPHPFNLLSLSKSELENLKKELQYCINLFSWKKQLTSETNFWASSALFLLFKLSVTISYNSSNLFGGLFGTTGLGGMTHLITTQAIEDAKINSFLNLPLTDKERIHNLSQRIGIASYKPIIDISNSLQANRTLATRIENENDIENAPRIEMAIARQTNELQHLREGLLNYFQLTLEATEATLKAVIENIQKEEANLHQFSLFAIRKGIHPTDITEKIRQFTLGHESKFS
jgi:hypothetical protein